MAFDDGNDSNDTIRNIIMVVVVICRSGIERERERI